MDALIILLLFLFLAAKILILACYCFNWSNGQQTRPRAARLDHEEAQLNLNPSLRETQARQMQIADTMTSIPILSLETQAPAAGIDLIIGVDSDPFRRTIGGYCIDLRKNSCEYYSLLQDHLPWAVNKDNRDSVVGELEMKNLMFALLLWEGQIQQKSRVEVYVDENHMFKKGNSPFSLLARKFIEHFNKCTEVKLNYVIVNLKDLAGISRYILPSRDLSRDRLQEALTYLKSIYGLEVFKGACVDQVFKIPTLICMRVPVTS